MLKLLDVITSCADILHIKQMDDARAFMVKTMNALFDATTVLLLGRDETNENFIELKAIPEKGKYHSFNIDKSERDLDLLAWAFKQIHVQSIKYSENTQLLKNMKQKFFPTLNFSGFVLVPGIFNTNTYPDLLFLIITNELYIEPKTLVAAEKLANFFTTYNRFNADRNQSGYRQELLERSVEKLSTTVKQHEKFTDDQLSKILLGTSSNMNKVRNDIRQLGMMDTTVLIQGDTGTGKELVAQELHNYSNRKDEPFTAVNMASLNPNLIESEFFGHCKGAFTGAEKDKEGYLSIAKKGTLFLDEIGDLPADLQAKLLRVLQEKKFSPVGSTKEVQFDGRIISATHKNLDEMMKENLFRRDLYYRIAESHIRISKLSERPIDIKAMAIAFVQDYNKATGTNFTLCDDCINILMELDYPGNVRQLKSLITNVCGISRHGDMITPDIIKSVYLDNTSHSANAPNPFALIFTKGLTEAVEAFEKSALSGFCTQFEGPKSSMAKALNISERSLYNKLKKHGLEGEENEIPL